MWCAKLRSELLAARDARQALLAEAAAEDGILLFLSLNLPGADKAPPGAEALFSRGLGALHQALPEGRELRRGRDRLGPFALLAAGGEPPAVKAVAVALEESAPWARLLDLDVFDRQGRPVDRAGLGLPPRSCLVCPQPARECIRLGRHRPQELKAATDALLLPFCR